MKIICSKEEQEKLVEILSNAQETIILSIIEWEREFPRGEDCEQVCGGRYER